MANEKMKHKLSPSNGAQKQNSALSSAQVRCLVDPKILARMKKDMSFINSRLSSPRIKLEKGHSIVVRFLPARLGPDKMWYARVAQHWLNEVPITCPRLTGDDFGGALDAYCPGLLRR